MALILAALGAAAEAAAPPAKANILYLVADDMCARQHANGAGSVHSLIRGATTRSRSVRSWSQPPRGADSRLPAGAPTSAATATPS